MARPAISDSPWFWVMLFSAAGVVCLLVVLPQYSKRQRRLEMQYYARQEIERRQVEGASAASLPGEEGSASPPAAGELIISLWPLLALCSVMLIVSSAMLWRNHRGPRADTAPSD